MYDWNRLNRKAIGRILLLLPTPRPKSTEVYSHVNTNELSCLLKACGHSIFKTADGTQFHIAIVDGMNDDWKACMRPYTGLKRRSTHRALTGIVTYVHTGSYASSSVSLYSSCFLSFVVGGYSTSL